jgi:hypothetical protein
MVAVESEVAKRAATVGALTPLASADTEIVARIPGRPERLAIVVARAAAINPKRLLLRALA